MLESYIVETTTIRRQFHQIIEIALWGRIENVVGLQRCQAALLLSVVIRVGIQQVDEPVRWIMPSLSGMIAHAMPNITVGDGVR